MTGAEKQMELKKALVLFMIIAVAVIAAGVTVGELFIWEKYNVLDPVDKDIAYYETLAGKQKDNDKILVELGWLYYRKGDYQKAINTLTKAVEINRLNPAAHFNLGLAYQEAGLLEKAQTEFQKNLDLDPDSKFAYFALGKLYFLREKWDEAISQFKLAAEKDPVSADNYFWLGRSYEKKGYKDEALAAYQKVLAMVPNHSEAKEAYYRLK